MEVPDIQVPAASGAVRRQGAAMLVIGAAILGLLVYSATGNDTVVDGPLSASNAKLIGLWVALLAIVLGGAGLRQLLSGKRHRVVMRVLGAMFVVTALGAGLILKNVN